MTDEVEKNETQDANAAPANETPAADNANAAETPETETEAKASDPVADESFLDAPISDEEASKLADAPDVVVPTAEEVVAAGYANPEKVIARQQKLADLQKAKRAEAEAKPTPPVPDAKAGDRVPTDEQLTRANISFKRFKELTPEQQDAVLSDSVLNDPKASTEDRNSNTLDSQGRPKTVDLENGEVRPATGVEVVPAAHRLPAEAAKEKRPDNFHATNDIDSVGNEQGHREELEPASKDAFGNVIPAVMGDVVEDTPVLGARGANVPKDSFTKL